MIPAIYIKKLEERFGRPIRYTCDIDDLITDIFEKTGTMLSVNTIKRLFGLIKETANPRLYTLDTIAKYLNYKDWDDLNRATNVNSYSEFGYLDRISSASLAAGDVVKFRYDPDRAVTLTYIDDNKFNVTESVNSKLKKDDEVLITNFVSKYPVIVTQVIRNGANIGNYIAGKISGLKALQLLKKQE